MVARNQRPVLHYRGGQTRSRNGSSRNKYFAFLSSILLLALAGMYLMIGQVFLMPANHVASTETITALDILRKERAERQQRQERLRSEAAAASRRRQQQEQETGTGEKSKSLQQDKKQEPQQVKEGEDTGAEEARIDEVLRQVHDLVREDGKDDDTNDDGESGDGEKVIEAKEEAADDDDDDDGDDTAKEKNELVARSATSADDDVAITKKLVDDAEGDVPLTTKLAIEDIRRRMDEELGGSRRVDRIVPAKLDRARDHDDKTRHMIAKFNPLNDYKKHAKKTENRKGNKKDDDEIDSEDNTPPRKLPKLERLATVQHAPIEGDPLRAEKWEFERKGKISIKPAVPYLGTLIDAGRHYFPIDWLKKAIDRLADMNYNLIHLRLTDDQTFNVLLKSRPQLAYPTALWNPDRKVYTADELRDLTSYAKERGIAIMPEVNVPGHAGAWAGIPDMIVHCPGFICEKGYGLPLNVTHHELKPILTEVFKEIIDIFDPPFLHLGGDEVNMADPCFQEVGHKVFDYPAFELVLKEIINATGYPEDQVVRWEMTGQKDLVRAGGIEQFWESHPGVRHKARGKYFVSTWLYFDTNTDQNAYEVYTKTIHNFHIKDAELPTAIIAGTFELNPEFWYDRNILGRLLAVVIGAANLDITGSKASVQANVLQQWNELCNYLGFGEIICDTDGQPVISTRIYHEKWRQGWEVWKEDICQRLTTSVPHRSYKATGDRMLRQAIGNGNDYFWRNFPLETEVRRPEARPLAVLPSSLATLEKHTVANAGVIIDAVSAMPKIERIHAIIQDYVVKLGMNTVQLRLINDNGWVYESDVHPKVAQSLIAGTDNPLYTLGDLKKLVKEAGRSGVQMIPEITTTSDAGGWINTQFLADCPDHFCSGQGTPININDEKYLPVLFSVVAELRKVFRSKFIHLGSDERDASAPCFQAAKLKPSFSGFERKLETLMALADLMPADIIRNDNLEGVRYPDRTGDITQYPVGVTEIRPDEKAFLTVDIFDGDGYRVFQNTQKAVASSPLGVLAELRKLNESKWKQWHVPKRLLAFAMGVSELGSSWSIYDAATFSAQFVQLCKELELEDDCNPPDEFMGSIRVITDSQEFIKKNCDVRTSLGEKKIAITVKPFFDVQANGEVVVSQ